MSADRSQHQLLALQIYEILPSPPELFFCLGPQEIIHDDDSSSFFKTIPYPENIFTQTRIRSGVTMLINLWTTALWSANCTTHCPVAISGEGDILSARWCDLNTCTLSFRLWLYLISIEWMTWRLWRMCVTLPRGSNPVLHLLSSSALALQWWITSKLPFKWLIFWGILVTYTHTISMRHHHSHSSDG